MFRWGNRGRRLRPKRERNVVVSGKIAKAMRGEAGADASTDAAAGRKRKRTAREMRGRLQYLSGWLMVLTVDVVCLLCLLILASQKIGPEETTKFMLTWGTAMMMAWVVVEPLEVAFVVFFPFLLENSFVANVRQTAKDLGLY
eukprot:1767314-Pleurochrysis_carterae.AAC.2